MNWPLLQNSLLVSALATLLAVGFGSMTALWLATLEPRWRRCFLALSIVALALPPFLVANTWIDLLGETGAWRRWLPFNIYSPGGAVWILTLLLWPITTLLVLGAWQRIEPAQLEVDPMLRGRPLIRWLLWPMARVSIARAAALTFVLALNNFAVPAILQVKVLPAEVWVKFNTNFDYRAALALSWPVLLAPLLLWVCLRHTEVRWPWQQEPAGARALRRQLGWRWVAAVSSAALWIMGLSVAVPLAQLAATPGTWTELPNLVRSSPGAIGNSFLLPAITASVCAALGLATWRWRIGAFVWIPFLVPGVLLGITLIFLFNRPVLEVIYQSLAIIVVGWTARYLAAAWQIAAQARRSVDRDLTDAARLDGASGWTLFCQIHWPQIAPRIGAAWYVVYLLCLWDVETLVLIVPPGGETLALRIFNLLHYGHNAQVNAMCLVLLGLALAPLFLVATDVSSLISSGGRPTGRIRAFLGKLLSVGAAVVLIGSGCSPRPALQEAPVRSRIFSRVQIIGARGTALGQFNKPRSVAVDADDNLFVVDMTGRVQKFSPAGLFLASWQMPETDLGKPKGMCRDAQGNIVVLEPHYQRVNHFTPDGRLVGQWGVKGTNLGEFTLPRAVAANSRGELFVSEYTTVDRVQSFAAGGGRWLACFGKPGTGDGEFNRAEGLGIDAGDRIFVADSCNHRIQIFSPAGIWIASFGRAGRAAGELSYPYDVRIDAQGLRYVCEFGNSRIQVFDQQNRPLEILGRAGSAPGDFSNPWGIALDSKGNLYVADGGNHRVQKFVRRLEGWAAHTDRRRVLSNPDQARSESVAGRGSGASEPGVERR